MAIDYCFLNKLTEHISNLGTTQTLLVWVPDLKPTIIVLFINHVHQLPLLLSIGTCQNMATGHTWVEILMVFAKVTAKSWSQLAFNAQKIYHFWCPEAAEFLLCTRYSTCGGRPLGLQRNTDLSSSNSNSLWHISSYMPPRIDDRPTKKCVG